MLQAQGGCSNPLALPPRNHGFGCLRVIYRAHSFPSAVSTAAWSRGWAPAKAAIPPRRASLFGAIYAPNTA